MRKNLLVLALLLISLFSKAQYTGGCIDSTMIQIGYICQSGDPPNFDPVCGCDGKTYRNACTAQYIAGVTSAQEGICGDYDIDLVPNIIVPGSSENSYGILSIYSNLSASALIQIYDVYGKLWYVQEPQVYTSPPIFYLDISMDGFPDGVYYLFVIMNGESQYVKLMKADRD